MDRFSKMAHFIPLKKATVPQLADDFLKEVWQLHGLPTSIISDRDPLFVSKFWDPMVKPLDISTDKLIPYHPQTDGQTKRLNQIIKVFLRAFINWDQDN